MFQWNERRAFTRRIDFVNVLHEAGVEGTDLLSRLYCEFLPDAAEELGNLVADHVLNRIRLFDETKEKLLDLDRKHKREKIKLLQEDFLDLLQDMSMREQCGKLRQIKQGMDGLDRLCKGVTSRKQIAQERHSAYTGSESEAGRDAELLEVLEKILAPEVTVRVQNKKGKMVFPEQEAWMDDSLYRAILTISLYTMMCNGECGLGAAEFPLSIEYIAVEVCCTVSDQKAAQKNEPPEEARKRQRINSTAVKLFLAAGILAGGTATVLLANSTLVVYSAYYVTVLAVGGLIISAAMDEDINTAVQNIQAERNQNTINREVRIEEEQQVLDTDKSYI